MNVGLVNKLFLFSFNLHELNMERKSTLVLKWKKQDTEPYLERKPIWGDKGVSLSPSLSPHSQFIHICVCLKFF